MKIATKLVTLIGIIVTAVIAVVLLLAVNIAPIIQVQNEQLILEDLKGSLSDVQVQILILPASDFKVSYEQLQTTLTKTYDIFDSVTKLELLNNFNEAISNALQIINNLKSTIQKEETDLVGFIERMNREITGYFGFERKYKLRELLTDSVLADQQDEIIVLVREYDEISEPFNSIIAFTRSILNNQVAIISQELDLGFQQSLIITLILSAGIFAIAILLASMVSRSLNRAIVSIDKSVNTLKGGNLLEEFKVNTKDEIANLANNLNQFANTLLNSFHKIKESANSNRTIRENLISSTEEVSSATRQMQANSESIKNHIEIMDDTIIESSKAIASISERIHETKDHMNEQNRIVNESSMAVTDMIASIHKISQTTEQSSEYSTNLLEITNLGAKNLIVTIENIDELSKGIEGIKTATGIIQSIAAQTNLLAMNAAIEAAHAGDAGKGFGVVADEIRKLAEAASLNSKEIAGTLKDMVEKIHAADDAGQETNRTYGQLNNHVHSVSDSFNEISRSIKNLETGSAQVLSTISSLTTTSDQVKANTIDIDERSDVVEKSIKKVENVSNQVNLGIKEINIGLQEINESMNNLLSMGKDLETQGRDLEVSVAYFKVEKEDGEMMQQ